MAPARRIFPAILVALLLLLLLLLPAISSDWFIRTEPDLENVDYFPNGGEIAFKNFSGILFSSEKIVFSGNSRFSLKSETATFLSGVNNSLGIDFSGENLTVTIAQFSSETGEVSYENPIFVSGNSAEAAFEGPIVSLITSGSGRKTLSISGIEFQEDGPGAILLNATDGEIYSVSGLANYSPERRLRQGALFSLLGLGLILLIGIVFLATKPGRKKSAEERWELERKEDLYEIQKSVFGKR